MPHSELPGRQALYDAGLPDAEIATQLGIKLHTFIAWRRYRNLPPNSRVAIKSRMVLYRLGWSDTRIAAEQGVTKASIRDWRLSRGLQPNLRQGVTERRERRPNHPLIARVRKAVGRGLSRDIRDEIVAEILLALLEGELPLDRIEAEARTYGNRVLGQFASRYGPRSIDAPIAAEEGNTLLDLIPDSGASKWLEEMGATVW